MTSVWIVESGEYSGYSVDAIFSTEEQAEAFATASGGSFREWPLDTWTPEQAEFMVMFDTDGDVVEVRETPYVGQVEKEQFRASSGNSGNIAIYTQRGPRERAVKIASEKFIQIRAKMDEALTRLELAGCADPDVQRRMQVEVASILAGIQAVPTGDIWWSRMLRSAVEQTGGAA